MNLGFGREKRLLKPQQFKAVFDSAAHKVSSKYALLLARDNQLGHPRLGLVIGKKNVKLAVDRNRIKRQIRESFRHSQHQLPGVDIVIVARRGIADLTHTELRQQFDKLWQRLVRQRSTTTAATKNTAPAGKTNA